MAEKIRAMRGTHDILPENAAEWRRIEEIFVNICTRYGYLEIRTPIFESTELFERGTGFATDVVQKEMYTFEDKKGRRISLRPEATPSVIRAYLEHGLDKRGKVLKVFYIGPMFRYDRPGAGRYRQFHQLGIEIIGTPSPVADAEAIVLLWDFLSALGLSGLRIRLNSLGCEPCRVAYSGIIKRYLESRLGDLCDDCNQRFERNPLRILDCKQAKCRSVINEAPDIAKTLCSSCLDHLARVEALLGDANVDFYIDSKLVRGLDYYTRTVFEIFHEASGVELSLGGGGRYDRLVEDLGGRPTPAVGFSAGMERIMLALEADGIKLGGDENVEVFIASIGEDALRQSFELARSLRNSYRVWLEFEPRKIDRQLATASRLGASIAILVGPEEMVRGVVKIKKMKTGEQCEVAKDKILGWIASALGGECVSRE